MKVDDDLYKKIRELHNLKKSVRAIARELKLNRKTVRKYCSGGKFPGMEKLSEHDPDAKPKEGEPERQRFKDEAMGECRGIIEKRLEEERQVPGDYKPRFTRTVLHGMIRGKYPISYPTLCRWLSEVDLMKNTETFVPLIFEAGEMIQVDFCSGYVAIEGVGENCKVQIFTAVLSKSFDPFVMVLPDQVRENFLYAHVRALEYFGGSPVAVLYDNLSQAVDKGHGITAVPNKEFMRFAAHYGLEPRFATKNKGSDKGLVENACKIARARAFEPKPRGKSLTDINGMVFLRLEEYRKTAHIRHSEKTILENSVEDRAGLRPLPERPYPACRAQETVVSKFLTFTYDTNRYSVPKVEPGTRILIKPDPFRIACYHRGELLVEHERSLKKHESIYVAEHYMGVLGKKTRAINNAAPLKIGRLPPELDEFRSRCAGKDMPEQLMKIMLLGSEYDMETVLRAVAVVNAHPNPTYDFVRMTASLMAGGGEEGGDRRDGLFDVELDEPGIYGYFCPESPDGGAEAEEPEDPPAEPELPPEE
jgi:transposase